MFSTQQKAKTTSSRRNGQYAVTPNDMQIDFSAMHCLRNALSKFHVLVISWITCWVCEQQWTLDTSHLVAKKATYKTHTMNKL